MVGLAQWWLARVLGLGRVARLWSAAMAVAGGHLAARMDQGTFSLLLSTAACSLIWPPLIRFCRTGGRRSAVLLAGLLALAVLSGGGYMQLGLVLAWPAAILLLPANQVRLAVLARRFVVVVGLTVLMLSVFLVPFLHFLPEYDKDSDPTLHTAQSLAYVPLNLVISDTQFYFSDALGKLPYPAHYANFIGWIPVGLAVWAVALWALRRGRSSEEQRAIPFLAATTALILWGASAGPQRLLLQVVTDPRAVQWISGFRFVEFMAGLAITPILALAAITVDRWLAASWARLQFPVRRERIARIAGALNLRWLLAAPLALALAQAISFSSQWIHADPIRPVIQQILQTLHPPDLQWVNVPRGEHDFVEPAIGQGLKLARDFFRTWHWKNRPEPLPVAGARIEKQASDPAPAIYFYRAPPGYEYAAVVHPDGSRSICSAHGTGGNLDVACDTPQAGLFVLEENRWTGWYAQVDGQAVELQPARWLAVELPAGQHTVTFRYRPWDVLIGLVLSFIGVGLACYYGLRAVQSR